MSTEEGTTHERDNVMSFEEFEEEEDYYFSNI